jgi:subtilisin family serine protease
MVHDHVSWRMKAWRAAVTLLAAALPFAYFVAAPGHAQSIMRTPNLNVAPRMPSIDPNVSVRIDPNSARFQRTPRLGCSDANRDSGGCLDQSSADGGGKAGLAAKNKHGNPHTVANEIVAEIDGSLSEAQADELARRHGLARLESQNFPLAGGTVGLFRVIDRRPTETVSREFGADASVRSVQPNFRYVLQDQTATLSEGDPAQYALAKLRLPQAHTLARGANVTIAVIDSGIDIKHPEFANSIVDSFDALGSKEGPHFHGTGVAGAIVAHARLMGAAPAARILAIRAFGAAPNGAESTSFIILKSLNYAVAHGAQIVNMSFAGPKDSLIERSIAATAARGILMVAAGGNAGAKSPPLYPAANTNVIAVSATDAQDRLFEASNRGGYIAVAAPGVDIFLPAPDGKYQIKSGTSFSAGYVSGTAALLLERNPALKPEEVRAILTKTARDLGAPGRDDLFGAGEADAFAAVTAVAPAPAVPVATISQAPAATKVSDPQDGPATRALNQPATAMASDKSASGEVVRPAAQ